MMISSTGFSGALGGVSGANFPGYVSGNYYGQITGGGFASGGTETNGLDRNKTLFIPFYVPVAGTFSHYVIDAPASPVALDFALFRMSDSLFGTGDEIDRVTAITPTGSAINEIAMTANRALVPGWYLIAVSTNTGAADMNLEYRNISSVYEDFGRFGEERNRSAFLINTRLSSVTSEMAFADAQTNSDNRSYTIALKAA